MDLAQHIADVGDGGAAEPGGFDAHSAVDEVEEIRQSAGGHSQMVDAHRGQFGEDRFQRQQQRGIDVELGVPADQIECAVGKIGKQTQVGGAAAQVEPDGTYSQCVQSNDVFIRRIERQSSDAHPAFTEFGQGSFQVFLVIALVRRGHHRAAVNAEALQRGNPGPVIGHGEGLRQVPVILDQREARVDDMHMGVKHGVYFALLPWVPAHTTGPM
ncbi:hypothetical protein A2J01_14635 [Rhodococcus sp. EPR-134]|nr:hypothetical protein A2J01_14635 [Rhodococcus sp. EPR-134]